MEQKNDSKVYLIIIAILLLIIGVGVGFYIGKNNNALETKQEEKEEGVKKKSQEKDLDEEKTDSEKKDNSDKEENKKIKKGSLKSEMDIGEKDVKVVDINNKQVEISYEIIDDDGPGTRVLKIGNKEIGKWSPNGIGDIKYEVVTGKDNSEYLLLTYNLFANYGYIVKDDGKILYSFDSTVKDNSGNLDCVAYFDDINDKMIYVENNEVYYYKYKNGTANEKDYSVKVDLVKLSINSNKVTEVKTGTEKVGKYGQCS